MVQSWGEMMTSNKMSTLSLHVAQMMASFFLNKK
jgi:hypothetical protein